MIAFCVVYCVVAWFRSLFGLLLCCCVVVVLVCCCCVVVVSIRFDYELLLCRVVVVVLCCCVVALLCDVVLVLFN